MAETKTTTTRRRGGLLPRLRRKLGRRQSGPITAIDLDGQEVHVVQASARGIHATITRVAVAPLQVAPGDRDNPAAIGQALAACLDHLGIKAQAVLMGVPRAFVVMRTLLLPAVDDVREIASMVHLQIAKDLPFRLDEAVIDFKAGRKLGAAPRAELNGKNGAHGTEPKSEPAAGQPKLEVLVAAVKKEIVAHYEAVAAAAGLHLIGLGWLSHANARLLEACQIARPSEAVGLVSLRLDEAGIDIVSQQTLLFSRGAAIKPRDHPDPAAETLDAPAAPSDGALPAPPAPAAQTDDFVEAVTIEVVRSLHSYSSVEPHVPVSNWVIAGSTGRERAVADALQARLNVPCSLLDAATLLRLPDSQPESAARSLSAIGLVLAANDPGGLPFDFINPKQPLVQRDLRRTKLLAAAAVVAALFVGLLALRAHLMNARRSIQAQVQSQLTEAEKKRPFYRQMRLQSATVQDWLNAGRDNLEHYAMLSAVLPGADEIYVTSLSMSGQGTIRLAVQARSSEVLTRLDHQLRAAGYDLKPLAITPGPDKFGYNFRTTVEMSAPAKVKLDPAKTPPRPRPADDISLENNSNRAGGGS